MWTQLKQITFLAVAAISVSACKVDVPNQIVIEGNGNGNFSCVASVSPQTAVAPGQPVTIQISGIAGTTPYSISGSGSFSSNTTVTRTYSNSSTAQIVIQDQVVISDSQGRNAVCSFQVNVTTTATNPSSLSCQMVGNVDSVLPNAPVTYTMVGNGTGNLTFYGFVGGDNSTLIAPLAATNAISASATVSYSTTGTKTASVMVTDTFGNIATCNDQTTVRTNPALAVTASPSSSVPAGTSIQLTASAQSFLTTPTITMTTSEPGVLVVPLSATTFRVDAADNLAHSNFVVTARAQTATETAISYVTLTFTSSNSQTLNCAISYPSGTYKVGDTVNFSVTANEPLNITYFSAPGGEILTTIAANPIPVRYNSAGTKTVYAYAQSTTTGKFCNNGQALEKTVEIQSGSSTNICSVVTYSNPSYAYEWFNVAVTTNPSIYGWKIYRIDATNVSNGSLGQGEWQYASTYLNAYARMYQSGTYQLKVTLRDDIYGVTTSCVTQHQVR